MNAATASRVAEQTAGGGHAGGAQKAWRRMPQTVATERELPAGRGVMLFRVAGRLFFPCREEEKSGFAGEKWE